MSWFTYKEGKEGDVVQIKTPSEILKTMTMPPSDNEKKHFEAISCETGEQLAQIHRNKVKKKLSAAEQDESRLQSELTEADASLQQAQAGLKDREPEHRFTTIIYLTVGIVCFVAEFSFTLAALPWALELERDSFLGICVSLAPATALLILELIFLRVLEEPWREMKKKLQDAGRIARFWPRFVMVVFLLALFAGNIMTVVYLADAREEISRVRHESLNVDVDMNTVALDRKTIDRAIVAVSVVVVLDGAMFFLLAQLGLRTISRNRQLSSEFRRCRSRSKSLEKELKNVKARLAGLNLEWEKIDETVKSMIDLYVRQQLIELESTEKSWRSTLSKEELVEHNLRKVYDQVNQPMTVIKPTRIDAADVEDENAAARDRSQGEQKGEKKVVPLLNQEERPHCEA